MPSSAVRGEELKLSVSIFNYFPHICLPLKVNLEVDAKEVLVLNRGSYGLCVCGGESASIIFRITPLHLGLTNLTVHAFSREASKNLCPGNVTIDYRRAQDSVQRTLFVKAEGLEKEFSVSKYVCVRESDDDLNAQTFFMVPPSDIVNGSATAFFSASGDIISSTLAGLERLVHLPTGCGEQNLILLAPNVFVLDYLTATKQLKPALEKRLLHNILTGYQRELNYRHPGGGYSAFGKMDPQPSLWLTAFVVRTFGGARHFVPIDQQDFDSSVTWLLKKQYENGCFPSIGTVLNSRIKGGLKEVSLVPLTAYALVSLLEAGTEAQVAYTNGATCLLAEEPADSYTLALSAYALALLEHPKAYQYLDVLQNRATIAGDKTHWQEEGESTGTAIETAAYAILATLKVHGVSAVNRLLPVVRWVLEQRNPNGGFVSTQDTVVALQALSEYAKLVLSTPKDLSLEAKTDGDFHTNLRIHRDNCLLQQEVKLPSPPFVLTVEASGTGCAFIQSTLRYNVHSMRNSSQFDLSVSISDGDCTQPKLTVCGRYLVPVSSSGMVTIEAGLVSGYIPNTESLETLLNTSQMKRYEVHEDQVNLYFDDMVNTETCVTFGLTREHIVENAAPAVVLLRDYYDPDEFEAQAYSIALCSEDGQDTILGRGRLPLGLYGDDRFETFKDVDFELEFPDGPEAPAEVTELPEEAPHSYDFKPCPTCWNGIPSNFSHLYCQSASVLRVQLLRAADHKVRVTHNVSPRLHRRLPVGDIAVHTLSKECSCDPLTKDSSPKNILLVLGARNMLSTTRLGTISLKVTGRTTVVSIPDMETEVTTLQAARKECPL